ncbi:MAG: TRAP transporter small permease [Deltaproteobacteria bacterium]|nr:TRAP transporter small permease [Deltaproteobacteria bacterium]
MKVLRWMDESLERVACSLLFIFFTFFMILNVFMRFVVGVAISWASDLVLFVFSWFVMFGMSYCFKLQAHIRVTVVPDLIPPAWRRYCALLVHALLFLFLLLMVYNGLRLLGDRSIANKYGLLIRYPMWSLYIGLPIGCALSLIRIGQNFYREFRNRPAAQ